MSQSTSNQLTPESLSQKLTEKLQTTHISIEDFSGGCGTAFKATVVSPQFENKRMLARHRLVNDVLKDEIAAIHAWSPTCFTPQEWEREREQNET
ncbi:MAG: hypothetical protein M1816_007077 [Peltula sp. TS41687]|nr:MAG: hypothetical protein M1816_007077 [Peltula sp. TS41687]